MSAPNPIEEITKPITSSSENSILSRLFRNILFDLGISPQVLYNMVTQAVIDSRITINKKNKKSRLTVSHTMRQLVNENMTIKTFFMGLFSIIRINKVEMIAVLHYEDEKNRHPTEHRLLISDYKESSETNVSILSTFFRQILTESNISAEDLYNMVSATISANNKPVKKGGERTKIVIAHMIRQLTDTNMTIKTFFTGIFITLRVSKISIMLNLSYNPLSGKKNTQHEIILKRPIFKNREI